MVNDDLKKKKNPDCPNCGNEMAEILYGLVPDPGDDLKNQKVFIGGCMVSEEDPIYHCYKCRRSYYDNLKDYEEEANDIFDDLYENQ